MQQFNVNIDPLVHLANRQVIEVAAQDKVRIFLVGGYLRDALLFAGSNLHQPKDFDYIVQGTTAIHFAKEVANKLHGHFVLLDESFDTARVVLESGTILDFAGCMGGKLEVDLKRRDFTINALSWDPEQPDKIIDLSDGLRDLKTCTIRAIAESNLCDDPLRLLRAFRFAATLGGNISPDTISLIKQHANLLSSVAPERISYELFLTLEARVVSSLVDLMGQTGLLEAIFPEMTAMRQVTPNAYHHLGLFDHSLALVNELEKYLDNLPEWVTTQLLNQLSTDVTRRSATRLACLLHDLGKPQTWVINPDGRHTFYGHDKAGAEMVKVISDRLRWARPVERFITQLVQWHLRPGQLFHQGPPTLKAVHRFYRSVGNNVPELILLALADLGATRGEGLTGREELEQNLLELLNGFPAFQNMEQAKPKLLDGKEIMELLSITPGSIVGELLKSLEEAVGLQEVTTKEEAMIFIQQQYKYLNNCNLHL